MRSAGKLPKSGSTYSRNSIKLTGTKRMDGCCMKEVAAAWKSNGGNSWLNLATGNCSSSCNRRKPMRIGNLATFEMSG